MIGPLIILDSAVEGSVVVEPAADVDDQIIVGVPFVEVSDDIFNGVAICLFKEVGGRKGHRHDPLRDVGEV